MPFDRKTFFAKVRSDPFSGQLSQSQVDGLNALLDAANSIKDARKVAYGLATAFHEAGAKMQPTTESLNYSVDGLKSTFSRSRISAADCERLGRKPGEPALSQERQRAIANIVYGGAWGRANLGNTEPDDGWTFRGRGYAQTTGRRNYAKASTELGADFLSHPELALQPAYASALLFVAMQDGWYTGHELADFFNDTTDDPVGARRIINGQDKATTIAGYHRAFLAALRAAGWDGVSVEPVVTTSPAASEPADIPVEPEIPATVTAASAPAGKTESIWVQLIAALATLFKRSTT